MTANCFDVKIINRLDIIDRHSIRRSTQINATLTTRSASLYTPRFALYCENERKKKEGKESDEKEKCTLDDESQGCLREEKKKGSLLRLAMPRVSGDS